MRTSRKLAAATTIIVAMMGLTSTTFAEEGGFSASIKVGQPVFTLFDDAPGITNEEDTATGFTLGYLFSRNLSAEIEYVSGTSEITGPARSLEIDIESTAFYLAYRSEGPLYFIGRVGYTKAELDSDATPNVSESGSSLGAGVGYRITPNLGLEIDYTLVEEDTSWLMLALRYEL